MESFERSASAKRVATVLNTVSIALFLVMWFPIGNGLHEVLIVFLFVLPLVGVGLVALSKGVFRFGGLRKDREPSVSIVFIVCGTALFIQALRDVNIFWFVLTPIVAPVLILGLLITVTIVAADSRTRDGIWAQVWLVATMYSLGAVIEANRYFDAAAPKVFPVEVLGQHCNSSARGPTLCYVHVIPWGPFSQANDVRVPTDLYDSVSSGQTVCIDLHPGALSIAWYTANLCR